MLILLPPSETKRDGGEGAPLAGGSLSLEEYEPCRREIIDDLTELAHRGDGSEMMRTLKLGPKLAHELARNRTLLTSPTMPAIERYTGVLYDALDALSLGAEARRWLDDTALVQSALLGPVRAGDRVPAYRLSHDSRLPGRASLRARWRAADELARERTGLDLLERLDGGAHRLALDLRSGGYAELMPRLTSEQHTVRIDFAERIGDGGLSKLNHFNKAAKGRFVRLLALERPVLASEDELRAWLAESGYEVHAEPRTLLLVPTAA